MNEVLEQRRARVRSRRLRAAVIVVLIAGGVAFLAYHAMASLREDLHADEVAAAPERYLGQGVIQVRGFARGVVAGESSTREFDLVLRGKSLRVRHQGPVPDSFREQTAVVVRGELRREGGGAILVTVGGEGGILTSCPSRYEAQQP